jgi:hypothetical protein
MKNTLRLMAAGALVLLVAAPAALAQTMEQSTLPVTEPLDVGGTILQPGTYHIRVLGNGSDRDRVVITNLDGTKTYTTVLTVPHPLEPNEEIPNATFIYYPAGEGAPAALRTWFAGNPPTLRGRDIVYDESRARQLARLASSDVVFYPPQTPIETATLQVVTPQAEVETYVAPVTPVITETPAPMVSGTTETESDTDVDMPETASRLPMLALLGLLSILGAVAIRFARG